MKPRKTILVFGASLLLNMLALPIAAPIMLENAKQATADKLVQLASELKPMPVIQKVQRETLEKAAYAPVKAMPPELDIERIAAVYPASQSDIIRDLLENN